MAAAVSGRPDPRALGELLRSCVQCGLCLPSCATWAVTGNEVLSPRGRLVLMRRLLADPGAAAEPEILQSFDQCIGCRACETACPSGVPFSLFEYGKELADGARRSGVMAVERAAVPGWLLRRLDRVPLLRALRVLAPLAPGPKLRELAAGLPVSPGSDDDLVTLLDGLTGGGRSARSPAAETPQDAGITVDFFSGCAGAGLLPGTSRRLIDLLRGCGCRVRIPAGQECCGALAAHTGRDRRRQVLHERNTAAFVPPPYGAGKSAPQAARWIVVEAAGCGVELKEQYDFADAKVLDATEALARLDLPRPHPLPLRVAYHAACHLEHGQRVGAAPRELLRRVPELELVEPEEAALCCGSGGVWSLEHPRLAGEIGERKARALLATGARLIVTTNPGCLGQIRGALAALGADLPVLPLTDLLWYACRM